MSRRIEDYALLGNLRTAALVARDGSLDWLCFPYFDSGACFAALLGTPENGRWLLAPAGKVQSIRRRYRPETLILETEFETADGTAVVIDFMPCEENVSQVVRLVVGLRGQVHMRTEMTMRFDYGSIVPWVRRIPKGLSAIAGPEMLRLQTPIPLRGHNFTTLGEFTVSQGERIPFELTWYPSYREEPARNHPEESLKKTEEWWRKWSEGCTYRGEWREAVLRSLITLKALTYAPTGGIVAAPTTSLPEQIGGVRNWDYRFCWLRDATFTLYSLLLGGFKEEARAWRQWLLRAVAGKPSQLQIMYGIAGERRLTEQELDWLPGYEHSKPVRLGNAAHGQLQLDVFGEVLDAMYQCRQVGLDVEMAEWNLEQALLSYLEAHWDQPDDGIWEVRGPRRYFTHSQMMVWVAFDRGVKSIEKFGLPGPVERWRRLRDHVHERVCREGYSQELGAFVQYFGAKELDASLLMMPLVGFLPADDSRVKGTVAAIGRDLCHDGFIARYANSKAVDGLPEGEGAFLACTFWYADNLALQGRHDEACRLYDRLLAIRNDVGLLSEEYDPHAGRFVGNFPQAFSHVSLVNTALNLSPVEGPSEHRPKQ